MHIHIQITKQTIPTYTYSIHTQNKLTYDIHSNTLTHISNVCMSSPSTYNSNVKTGDCQK